jgi:predicted Holliday junction resolvase-like endonuclease
MNHLQRGLIIVVLALAICSCGDKKDSAERNLEAQKAIQEGMQKEKQMYEGMQKGAESMEKKMQEQKEEPKK